jgi:hypothetical protein
MEITKYYDEYLKHSTKDFFDWISQGRVMEVRFLSDRLGNKFWDFQLIKDLGESLNVETRFTSLFINDYETLKKILLHRVGGYPLTKLYNIFISVNPKRKAFIKSKNGLIRKSYYGGIAGTSHIQNILCDIEHNGDRAGNATEKMIDECIDGAQYLIKLLNLGSYYLNISGNGVHLWIRMEEAIPLPEPNFIELDDKLKYQLREEPIITHIKQYNKFIEHLNSLLKSYNPALKVDEGAKDIARIARPTGSWNVKRGKVARAVGTVQMGNKINKDFNLKFTSVLKLLNKKQKEEHKIKKLSSNHRYTATNLEDSPLYKLMTSRLLPSTLSRNHYLEQSFALLLRDNNIDLHSIPGLIQKMDATQMKNVQVDPSYLDEDLFFNSEMVNNYCIECKVDLVYPLLEEYPNIQDGFITEEKEISLNSYSTETLEKIRLEHVRKPKNYGELKALIRQLIGQYSRSEIYFTLKFLYSDDWVYYNKNSVIVQLLNKTRKIID